MVTEKLATSAISEKAWKLVRYDNYGTKYRG